MTTNLTLILKTITPVFFSLLFLVSNSHVLCLSPNKTAEHKVQLRMNIFSGGQTGAVRYRRQRSDPNFFLLSHDASAEQGDPFYQEKLGTCFKDRNQFIRNVIGEHAADDQNLISTQKESWHWITDQTATENYAWYLLEERKGLLCWRIFIPAANDLKFIRNNQRTLLRAIIAPKPDFPSKTIYLTEQKNMLAFKAYKCLTSKPFKHKNEISQIPCHDIYE